MTSPNILLTRIDNRLVHGQVGVTWTSTIGANLLVVVDDVVANDDIQQKLMGITAETYGFDIRFFTIEKTINVIGKAAPHQKIFLICRTPQTVRKLVEGGIDLKDVNVGNMHFSEGKKQISSKVYVDDQDLTDLRFIKQRGVNVFIQDVPGDQKEQIPD
ncbi:PTS galactosamine transporter subunit IIB [Escherichia coli]|uniref:PTS galactosamine transporter subunit IIB n=1 Tax=Escherichia coli TaxID=562 RepID=UPI000950FDCF|nr:PTS galactosamine transporter subunit IIB [Escherichia coli]OLR81280.1 PTS N-acetylgalactosamine transporter subunit IIB [Escherichia coli]